MNMAFFLFLFGLLSLVYLIMGVYASQGITTNEEYFLADRKLGLWSIVCTLVATQVGGGFLLGTAAEAYNTGYYGMFYNLAIAFAFLILGLGLAAQLREFNIATLPELFTVRYNSPFLRKVASVLCVLSLSGITGGLVVSSRTMMCALGIHNEWVLLLFWAVIIAYPVIGGLKAIRINDMVQLTVIVTIFMGVFIYCLSGEPQTFFSINHLIGLQSSFSSGAGSFSSYFLMPVLSYLFEQDLAQQFFAARTKKVAITASFIACISIVILTFIPVYFGMKAKLLGLPIPAGANPLIFTLSYLTNDAVMALVICAILAAVISTAVSLLCAVGSLLAQDFGISFSSARKQLIFSKMTVFISGISAVGIAYFFDNILALMAQSYELPVSCLFVPFAACVVLKGNLKKTSAMGAIIGGALGFFLFRFWPLAIPREIASLGVSLIGYLVGSLFFTHEQ